MARIGIDCRLGGLRHAGIGRYVQHLVRELLDLQLDHQLVLFFFDAKQAERVLGVDAGRLDDVLGQHQLVMVPIRHYSLAEQLNMPAAYRAAQLDLLHVPHFNVPWTYPGNTVVTIHDLLWHQRRGRGVTTLSSGWYWLKYLGYRLVVTRAVGRAEAVIVPSQSIRQVVRHYYPHQSRVEVIPEGVDAEFFTSQRTSSAERSHDVLYVGSLYPHKNIETVLSALQLLPDFKLRIVTARNAFLDRVTRRVDELGLSQRVIVHPNVDDAELIKLHSQVRALVQPSLSEGFGLTGLEAMAAGTPVVASDIAVFREVYASAAEYFNPHQPQDLAAALRRLDPKRQRRLSELGVKHARRFQWQTTARQTLAVYERVINN